MSSSEDNNLRITIRYMADLRNKVGHSQQELTFKKGSTLSDVSDRLNDKYNLGLPNPQIMTILNGKGWLQYPMKMRTSINEEDVISLFPPISGG